KNHFFFLCEVDRNDKKKKKEPFQSLLRRNVKNDVEVAIFLNILTKKSFVFFSSCVREQSKIIDEVQAKKSGKEFKFCRCEKRGRGAGGQEGKKKAKITVDDINNNDIFTYLNNEDIEGGMQDSNGDNDNTSAINEGDKKHEKEIKALIRLFGDSINKEELKQKIINNNGNIELVIKGLVQLSVENEVYYNINNNISYCIIIDVFFILKRKRAKKQEQEQKQENTMSTFDDNNKSIQKEMEKAEIGETKPGVNLQGYCINEMCLASKAKLTVWINIGFDNITFISDKTSFNCPDCKKGTVTSIVKAMFYNSEHSICASGDSIPVKDNNYQSNKIKQHAKSIEDLRERSENAMNSIEIKNLVTELQKYEIT
ncbi:hypothetical protein RFI_30262, partial [Reticulomyxa filosa]